MTDPPVRQPGRRPYPGPTRRVNAVVVNGRLVDVFDALCHLEGRKPHQLVHDIVSEHCRQMESDPAVRRDVRAKRRHTAGDSGLDPETGDAIAALIRLPGELKSQRNLKWEAAKAALIAMLEEGPQ